MWCWNLTRFPTRPRQEELPNDIMWPQEFLNNGLESHKMMFCLWWFIFFIVPTNITNTKWHSLARVFERIGKIRSDIIIAGDFNQPIEQSDLWPRFQTKGFYNLLQVCKSKNPNLIPTCESNGGETWHDTILVKGRLWIFLCLGKWFVRMISIRITLLSQNFKSLKQQCRFVHGRFLKTGPNFHTTNRPSITITNDKTKKSATFKRGWYTWRKPTIQPNIDYWVGFLCWKSIG